jgi:PEGA domain-containing protein
MRSAKVLALFLATLLGPGCGESTLLRSRPAGAKVWVNDKYIGTTPVEYFCPRPEFSQPQRYRLELDGYLPSQGELSRYVHPGRIIGGGFSLGISLIFKRPVGFRDRYDFSLVPEVASAPSTGGRDEVPQE